MSFSPGGSSHYTDRTAGPKRFGAQVSRFCPRAEPSASTTMSKVCERYLFAPFRYVGGRAELHVNSLGPPLTRAFETAVGT